jgi:hypothetical protein
LTKRHLAWFSPSLSRLQNDRRIRSLFYTARCKIIPRLCVNAQGAAARLIGLSERPLR